MKTAKVKVNKTEQNPEGVEIEIVQPESNLEGRVLAFLLTTAMHQAKSSNRIPYKLPNTFTVEHSAEGTFLVMGNPSPSERATPLPGGGYYQPPRPLAIVGIRATGNRFDLVHAELAPPGRKTEEARKEPAAPTPQPAVTTQS